MKGRVNKEISKYYENKLNLNNKITTKLRIWDLANEKKKKLKKKMLYEGVRFPYA